MLTNRRRIVADAGRRLRQMDPWREQRRWPGSRVIALNEGLSYSNMRIFEDLASRQNGSAKIVQFAQAVPQFLAGFLPRPRLDHLFQIGLVLAARGRSHKTGILHEIVPF